MDNYGLLAEIVTAVFKSVNIDTQYNFYPWKRVEGNIYHGIEFAAFPYMITEERSHSEY